MSIVFSGPDGVATYQAIVLKHGLALYAKTRMRPNRAWTPTAMLATAGKITGKTYKRGAYAQAVADLEQWIEANGTAGEG